MDRIPIRVFAILVFLLFPMSISVEDNVKQALVQFMVKLSAGNLPADQNWGWNNSSDPCKNTWKGVFCDSGLQNINRIVLDGFNLNGSLDASSVCIVSSLNVLSLEGNGIVGLIPEEIGNCKRLTHLYIQGNRFSGSLPNSLSQLSNLKRLDMSNNSFSGDLPGLSRISGLLSFLAENNQLSGAIPDFDFSNLQEFNVSNNNFSGQIPEVNGKFVANSFLGNPELCGKPLSNACPPSLSPPPSNTEHKHSSKDRVIIFSGYIILGLVVLLLIVYKLVSRKKPKEQNADVAKKRAAMETSIESSGTSSELKTGRNRSETRSEYSITSAQSGMNASSLVVLKSPLGNGLTFEDLLRAPAELLGRGKHGSLYKVVLDDGVMLAVKRMKDWGISTEDFRRRMQRIDQVKHPRVLPPVAFYCSKQEKLLVYEFQANDSLFNLLHGSLSGKVFDWGSRLHVAAIVAQALAFMHERLGEDGIAHGNLKSTNILFNTNMEPCISEYGLMVVESQDQAFLSQTDSFKNKALGRGQTYSTFKVDVHGFGVILLELLTGKLVQNSGIDLARWVHSMVREEWTVEVFDKSLISEGASEERMVSLLQVALKCINPSPHERPSMSQISAMINTIEEEEERSISSEP